jgi:hypothetical protein
MRITVVPPVEKKLKRNTLLENVIAMYLEDTV